MGTSTSLMSNLNTYISKVASLEDLEEIHAWEQFKLKEKYSQDKDKERCQLLSWEAPWRKESLEYYFSLGWSFLLRSSSSSDSSPSSLSDSSLSSSSSKHQPKQKQKLVGYYLAQPLLFYRSRTQSLWVEYMQFKDSSVQKALCQLAIQSAKDKHLQEVLFYRATPSESLYNPIELEEKIHFQAKNLSCWVVSTTKARF